MLEHRTSEEEEIISHSYIIIMVCNMYMIEYIYIYPVSSLHSAHGSMVSVAKEKENRGKEEESDDFGGVVITSKFY